MRNTITTLGNIPEGYNSKLDEVEKWISELEDKTMELTQSSKEKKKWHIQGKPHMAHSRFLSRNFEKHKGVTWYFPSAERNNFKQLILYPERLLLDLKEYRAFHIGKKLKSSLLLNWPYKTY